MTSPDERREVAWKLRKLASENQGTLGSMRKMQEVMTQAQMITGTMHLPSVAHVLERYADLIEPEKEAMCCDVSDDESVFECSRCGCVVRLRSAEVDAFENVTYGPTLTMPNGRVGKLSFCPHCGAMVVIASAY